MRLAKLTLSGFKSFADRTEFTFDDSIVGIVGPNGCGKSNIVDAIKWVLGERSSKSLRGKEMTDVIFAGSAARKPLGLASVTLSFENPVIADTEPAGADPASAPRVDEAPEDADEDSEVVIDRSWASGRRRALPLDADMVEVERRLYRDGGSQYLINGRRARLKDIRDLFLDTGIGADAYSIIEQGKVDAMLLASPQERRTIFEEAAGIAKYKQRRVEAQRKLERAQANLALTREQLAATERRLRTVKGQAAKARRFRELDAEHRALRTAVAFEQYDDLHGRLEGLTSRLAELETSRRQAAHRLAQIEAAKQEAELARHDLAARQKELQEQRLAARHAEQSAAQRKGMTERALAEARAKADADRGRLGELDARMAELNQALERQDQAVAALAARLAAAEHELKEATEARAAVLAALADAQALVGERRAAVVNIDRELAALRGSVQAEERRAEAIGDETSRLHARRQAGDSEIATVHESLAELTGAQARRRAAIAALEAELASTEAHADSISQGRRELAERLSTLQQQHLRLDSRRSTLQEMAAARVGLGDAVRAVLDRRDAGESFAGVIAPLADLLETDTPHARAVEAALGPNLQALVVKSVEGMPPPSELALLAGRVTFLPLTSPEPRPDEATDGLAALVHSGGGTPLRSAVRVRADEPLVVAAGALLDRLLGRTILVDDLDAAMALLASGAPGARFVTRDGCLVEPDGRLAAGPLGTEGDSVGMLQRRSELGQLERQLADLGRELDAARSRLEAADAQVAGLSDRQSELRAGLAAEQRGMAVEQARAEQLAADVSRRERERRNLEEEAAQLSTRLERLSFEQARLRERIERLAGLHDEQSQQARDAESALEQAQRRAEAAGERTTGAKVECGRLGEQADAARRERSQLVIALEQGERDRREVARAVEQASARLEEHEQAIHEAQRQIECAGAEALALEAQCADVQAALDAAADRAQSLGERVIQAREQAGRVERDWHSLEVSRREVEVKREGLEERAQQELALDLRAEHVEYRELVAGGDVERADPARAAPRIEQLRDEIRRLGNVNLDAIDEESQLEQRNDQLIRQVADIDDAARRLAELIEHLNIASRQRFGETFGKIQEHFAGQSGMFRRLFGGGRAEVRLMPLVREVDGQKVQTDEIDLLESGIEVIAKPPGKEPRTINLLSGGEKTLTAVALLLSIFQSRPSCFCVLDEVDAALDDANVERYCRVVRQFTDRSHFIVITHNKRTMHAADRLYGITMQERGVSARVSVRFEPAGQDGHAPLPPLPAPETPEYADEAPENGKRRDLLRRALSSLRPAEAGERA